MSTRLLQLASPALPVGAYSYSQGLEWAIECGDVVDAVSAQRWIADHLCLVIARFEAPVYAACHRAWLVNDAATVVRLNAEFRASRESAEPRAETAQVGFSYAAWCREVAPLTTGQRATLAWRAPTGWHLADARGRVVRPGLGVVVPTADAVADVPRRGAQRRGRVPRHFGTEPGVGPVPALRPVLLRAAVALGTVGRRRSRYLHTTGRCRTIGTIAAAGPSLVLDAQAALHLALVLHELGTNARKYGALSVPGGRLSLK